jgi:hypothetical protein
MISTFLSFLPTPLLLTGGIITIKDKLIRVTTRVAIKADDTVPGGCVPILHTPRHLTGGHGGAAGFAGQVEVVEEEAAAVVARVEGCGPGGCEGG